MEKKTQKTATNTKQLIEQEAIQLFYDEGYSKTTLRKIAEKCNISHSGIFNHYKNKNELASLFVDRYFSWLIKESLKFTKTCHEEELSNQYPLLYYWTLHYVAIRSDENFSAFEIEYANKGFNSILVVAIKYAQHLPRILSKNNYNKNGNDLFIDVNILAHSEMALSEMVYRKQIDINRAVLFAVKIMNLIDNLNIEISQEKIDIFINQYFPIDKQNMYFNLLEMIAYPYNKRECINSAIKPK